jgi:environmental stress-induced protein Ves
MRHLAAAAYRAMPWSNGRGTTLEMLRQDGPDGLLLRLSMASVIGDGPFSIFPGIERTLTVISGPGFRLTGEGLSLVCAPLVPVFFPGDLAVRAEGTGGVPSVDFNVMTARALPRPDVTVEPVARFLPAGGTLYLFALAPAVINGVAVDRHDLIVTGDSARIDAAGPVIAVRLQGQTLEGDRGRATTGQV